MCEGRGLWAGLTSVWSLLCLLMMPPSAYLNHHPITPPPITYLLEHHLMPPITYLMESFPVWLYSS